MDPNAALATIRAARTAINNTIEGSGEYADAVTALVDYSRALDEWLIHGGFLPEDWSQWRDN